MNCRNEPCQTVTLLVDGNMYLGSCNKCLLIGNEKDVKVLMNREERRKAKVIPADKADEMMPRRCMSYWSADGYCGNCGTYIDHVYEYCPYCGCQLRWE